MNKERLDKQRRQARALARIAQEERERTLATLAGTEDGKRLLDLMSDLGAEPVEAWPDLVAGNPWLLAAPSDFRTTAVRLIDDAYCARLNAAGLDPMDEPLPWEDASPFQQIRWTLAVPLKPTPQPAKVSLKLMLNMTLTGPDDVPVLRATVAALHGALFGTTALTSATDAPASGEDEPAKRKRRTKAEIEADNAAAEAAKNTAAQPAAATPEPAPAPTDEDDVLAMLDDTPAEPEAPKNPWDACYSTTYTQDQINKAFRDWAIKAGSAATRAVLNHLKVGNSRERVDVLDLVEWSSDLLDAAEATTVQTPKLAAGGHCGFCPAAHLCPELEHQSKALAVAEFEELPADAEPTVPDPSTLSPERLAFVLDRADILETWLKAVRAHAFGLLNSGGVVPGYKLVQGLGRRVWADEVEAAIVLDELGLADDDYAPRKVISPAQAEKAVGALLKAQGVKGFTKEAKSKLAGLTFTPRAAPTLARDEDPRQAITGAGTAASEFDAITD